MSARKDTIPGRQKTDRGVDRRASAVEQRGERREGERGWMGDAQRREDSRTKSLSLASSRSSRGLVASRRVSGALLPAPNARRLVNSEKSGG